MLLLLLLLPLQTLLRKDFEMLSSFKLDSACRVICDGNTFEPRWGQLMDRVVRVC